MRLRRRREATQTGEYPISHVQLVEAPELPPIDLGEVVEEWMRSKEAARYIFGGRDD